MNSLDRLIPISESDGSMQGIHTRRTHVKEYNSGCMSLTRLDDVEFDYGFAKDPIRWRLGEIHTVALVWYGSNRVSC